MKQCLIAIALIVSTLNGYGSNAVKTKEFKVDPPTLTCLGFVWMIEGDENRNATASVEFRENGEKEWKSYLPLMRTGGFAVGRSYDWLDHTPPDALAGSIMDLKPGAEYEVKITALDPDGVEGDNVQAIKVRTRSVPVNPEGGTVYHVFPPGQKTNWTKNEFNNLYKAYYGGVGCLGDFNMVWERIVQPGDTILVHAGVYKANLNHYTDPTGLVADGTYWLTAIGTREKPIVIKAAGDGEVVFDGAGADMLFNVMAADYHTFEGITFRDCGYAIFAGQQRVTGCKGLVVRNCRFENVRDGIFTLFNGCEDFYIADNVFLGKNSREGRTNWGGPKEGYLKSNTAITLQGTGHVVCRNAIAYFWQGYHMGTAFQGYEKGGGSCDLYNNDLFMLIDDGFEIDGCVRNVRVMRNRIVDTGSALSTQPVYGGPAYFIRNVSYSCRGNYKFHEAWPSGLIVYHNTAIGNSTIGTGQYTNARFANNLFLYTENKTGMMAFPSEGHDIASDYNGYGNVTFRITEIDGKAPIMDKTRDPYWPLKKYPPKEASKDYSDFAEFQKLSGLETHSIQVDYSIFESMKAPEKKPGNTADPIHLPASINFKLNPEGAAVDKGVIMPGINDGFEGKAPDLGAYETGEPVPHYGPLNWEGFR